jgi:benzoate/toluate 1,2-dioxygenase subunit alpha
MSRYRNDPRAIRALVRPDEIHRDVYLDPELFDLEMEQLWRHTWLYVGHDSQVPNPGDFYTTELARVPVLMIRGTDGLVRVLPNRCAHKGTRLASAVHGKCVGGALRCPYHGWTYRLDGTLHEVVNAAHGGIRNQEFDKALRMAACTAARPRQLLTEATER